MGVTIKVLDEGDGKNYPKIGQLAVVHYVGRFQDTNKEFDSSISRGRPFEFVVGAGQVIKGWDQALQQMSVGERSEVTCTADFAYGERGHPGVIPSNATLVFEITLQKIKNPNESQRK